MIKEYRKKEILAQLAEQFKMTVEDETSTTSKYNPATGSFIICETHRHNYRK